jgi:hypothetical protein
LYCARLFELSSDSFRRSTRERDRAQLCCTDAIGPPYVYGGAHLTCINPVSVERGNVRNNNVATQLWFQLDRAMNYTIATANFATHIKIIVVALFWAILVIAAAVALH